MGAIVAAHLFGEANAPAAAATDPNAVAATQMPLVLVGTIAHSDPEQGYAIIGESAQTAKVYGVGKTITGGTKLHSVYPDRAIIDRGGKLEALLLPKKFTGRRHERVGGARVRGGRPDPMLGERLRQLAANNPGAITEILRPQPVFANGQQRGYRVYPGRNRQQFNKLGLLPGDMVTAINGTPLDDPARGMEILSTMNSAANVTVTVERNGETVQVNINNAQIAADAAVMDALPDAVPVEEVPAMNDDGDPRVMTMNYNMFQTNPAGGRGPRAGPGARCGRRHAAHARRRAGAGHHHPELQGRRPLADHRGGQRRHRQELHRRPAREGAGDDAVVDADDAERVLRGVPLDPAGARLRGRALGRHDQDPARRERPPGAGQRPALARELDVPTRSSRRWSRSGT